MAQPYIGEIRMFGGTFAPAGWMFCNGQTMPIAENEELFTLIGTTYGGDGESTFGLPDLQSRVPVGWGNAVQLAEKAGVESRVAGHAGDADPHAPAGRQHGVRERQQPAGQRPRRQSVDRHVPRDEPVGGAGAERDHADRRLAASREHAAVPCASASSSRCSGSTRSRT